MFPLNATEEGVYDMGGNVYEWCLDWFDVEWNEEQAVFYKQTGDITDPLNNETGELGKVGKRDTRVLRGGSWLVNVTRFLRCCYRLSFVPAIRGSIVGFRVVLCSPELHP